MACVRWVAVIGICWGCGGVEPAEHRALAERVEHLQQRLDALERRALEERRVVIEEPPIPAAPEPVSSREEALTIRVAPSSVEIDGRVVADDDLDAELRRRAAAKNVSHVILEADASTPHARLVAIMDRVRSAGFEKLAVAARRSGTGTGTGTGTEEAGL